MGADYKKCHRSVIGGQSGNTPGPGITRYIHPSGSNIWAAEVDARMRIPFSCVISNLYVRSNIPPGAGETFDYAIMLNGIATALVCQIAGAVAVEDDDLVNQVAVTAGDELSLRIITSAAAAGAYHGCSFEVRH